MSYAATNLSNNKRLLHPQQPLYKKMSHYYIFNNVVKFKTHLPMPCMQGLFVCIIENTMPFSSVVSVAGSLLISEVFAEFFKSKDLTLS